MSAEPTASSSRSRGASRSPPPPPDQPLPSVPSGSMPRSRSRSPSPPRPDYSYPQRYNLPPLRSLGAGTDSPSPHIPSQLPRLVLKTQHLPVDGRESHSRQTAAAYSTLRSGSTSPADYLNGGRAHIHGQTGAGGSVRERRYSGGSIRSRSASIDPSEASLPPASADRTDMEETGVFPKMPVEGEKVSPTESIPREYGLGPGQARREEDMGPGSGRVTPSAVLPPIPRTTKVVAPVAAPSVQATPIRRAPINGTSSFSANSNAKSRKSSCDLCHHRKIRVSLAFGVWGQADEQCDQGRPACGSCTRKGHVCVYADDTDRPTSRIITPTNRSVTLVSATNPGETTTVTIPLPDDAKRNMPVSPNPPPPFIRTASRGGPEWAVAAAAGLPTPVSAVAGRERGADGQSASWDQGRRVNGTSTDLHAGQLDGFGLEDGRDQGMDEEGLRAAAELAHPSVKVEVDELESDHDGKEAAISGGSAAPSGVGSASGKGKRIAGEDDVSAEVSSLLEVNTWADDKLLELASGPPKKKKKPRQSAPAMTNGSLRVSQPNAQRGSSTGTTSGSSSSRRPGTGHSNSSAVPTPHLWTDIYSSSVNSLMSSLPSADIQRILFDTFFTDPFLNEGITLLQPQFMEDLKSLTERNGQPAREGDATTLANAFAILGTALRILPDETSHLLLASAGVGMQGSLQPKSLSRILVPQLSTHPDPTPLDQRYFDLALLCSQMAESGDSPSVMLVMLKLVLYRNLAIRKDRHVIAGQYLGGAIRIAQALGMGKEWEGIPQGERELRRRVMWCLYIADRHLSFETAFPYTILDAHQGIHLPSPISEADLYKIAQDAQSLPPHSTEVGPTACTALFIHTHLARRITPILDSFATISPSHTPHDLVLRFDQSLDNFQDALPPYMRLFPGTDTRFDSSHSYLAAHRIRLHARILAYRQGVHRSFVTTYLRPSAPSGIRGVMANICLSSLRTQRSAKMLDPKIAPRIFEPLVVFESAMILGMILHVDKAISGAQGAKNSAEGMMWREGLANGVELLDHISGGVDVARRGVKVLREMCTKVDSPVDVKPFAFDGAAPNGSPTPPDLSQLPRPGSSHRPSTSRRINAIDAWLDGMIKERRSLELLLKDPQWEGAWEVVLAAM